MAGRNVIGVARQYDQVRVADLLLPGAGLVDRSKPTPVGRYDERRAADLRHIGPDVGAGDRLHKADLRGYRGAAHELDPPFDPFGRKLAAEAAGHRAARPTLDSPSFEFVR